MAGLKIIAGNHRGRPLRAPAGLATRPTSGRVREALFNILGNVEGLAVLDLYAGSGALGLEALSRGARSATFVEASREALSCLRKNVSDLGLGERSKVLPLRLEQAKQALPELGPFDLVLCDPPWADLVRAVSELERWVVPQCLAPGGTLVLEHPAREIPGPIAELGEAKHRTWGDTGISLYSAPAR